MSQRNHDVDDWFAAKQHPLTEAMQRARALILDADPRVTGRGTAGAVRAWCSTHELLPAGPT